MILTEKIVILHFICEFKYTFFLLLLRVAKLSYSLNNENFALTFVLRKEKFNNSEDTVN